MKLRAVALVAAFAVVAAGAVTPAAVGPDAAADVPASASPASASPASVNLPTLPALGLDPHTGDTPTPPSRITPADLSGTKTPRKTGELADGALATVVEALEDGEAVPDELLEQVRTEGERIRVEITHSDATAARAAIATAEGSDVAVVTDTLLVANVPASRIADLEAAPAVLSVVLPTSIAAAPDMYAPTTVGTKGADVYDKTKIAQWHKLGVTGAGVSIAIVDYFDKATWADAQAKKEVPAPAGTFCRSNGITCDVFSTPRPTGLHGVGVAEAIHDMAPKAKLYLATVTTNEDLRKAIDYFASKGVRILSRSLGGFYDGDGTGKGPSAQLVDYAVSKGITWFNAAGNAGASVQTYTDPGTGTQWKALAGGYWRGEWRDVDGNGWMEFAQQEVDPVTGVPTGAITYSELMEIKCSPYFRLRWNDWDASLPTDYDIYRIDAAGRIVAPGYAASYQSKKGDRPLELHNGSDTYFQCTPGEWITVAIELYDEGSGTAGDVLELHGNSADIYLTASSPYSAAQAFNDSRNPGMATVGAVDPVAGTKIAGYSSQGPTNDNRTKPELSAGSNFTSRAYQYGGLGGRFNGTSAATPVVAGAAAVVLQRYPSLSPAKLITHLRAVHATDRGVVGVDNVYGTGELVMAPLAVAKFTSTTTPKITGVRAVGSTLTAVKPTFTPAASFTYQWFRGSTAIPGATKSTYKLVTADGGKKLRVQVTGTRGGFTTVKKFSAYTVVIAKLFTKAPTPKITGTTKVGRTLTAAVGTWSPKQTKATYQWKRDGKNITGATKKTYKLKSADAGKRITVTVKVSKVGYKTTSKTSAKTAKIRR